MAAWGIWLIVALGVSAAEILSGDFFLLMIGGGAAAGAIAAALGAPVWLQFLVFAIVALALVLGVRPLARRALSRGFQDNVDGAQVFIGSMAVVTQAVDTHGGRIKIGGDEWSALSQAPYEQFVPGQHVRVVDIRGAHAIVAADPELTT